MSIAAAAAVVSTDSDSDSDLLVSWPGGLITENEIQNISQRNIVMIQYCDGAMADGSRDMLVEVWLF